MSYYEKIQVNKKATWAILALKNYWQKNKRSEFLLRHFKKNNLPISNPLSFYLIVCM